MIYGCKVVNVTVCEDGYRFLSSIYTNFKGKTGGTFKHTFRLTGDENMLVDRKHVTKIVFARISMYKQNKTKLHLCRGCVDILAFFLSTYDLNKSTLTYRMFL